MPASWELDEGAPIIDGRTVIKGLGGGSLRGVPGLGRTPLLACGDGTAGTTNDTNATLAA